MWWEGDRPVGWRGQHQQRPQGRTQHGASGSHFLLKEKVQGRGVAGDRRERVRALGARVRHPDFL